MRDQHDGATEKIRRPIFLAFTTLANYFFALMAAWAAANRAIGTRYGLQLT
jgi:hypothetical protein